MSKDVLEEIIKKKIETVLLVELFLIRYIRMVKAPKETSNI